MRKLVLLVAALAALACLMSGPALFNKVAADDEGPQIKFFYAVRSQAPMTIHVEAAVGEILGDFHLPPPAPLQAAPLKDPLHSTFAMVIRDHGPASSDPAELYLQLHTHQTGKPGVTDYAISFQVPPP